MKIQEALETGVVQKSLARSVACMPTFRVSIADGSIHVKTASSGFSQSAGSATNIFYLTKEPATACEVGRSVG